MKKIHTNTNTCKNQFILCRILGLFTRSFEAWCFNDHGLQKIPRHAQEKSHGTVHHHSFQIRNSYKFPLSFFWVEFSSDFHRTEAKSNAFWTLTGLHKRETFAWPAIAMENSTESSHGKKNQTWGEFPWRRVQLHNDVCLFVWEAWNPSMQFDIFASAFLLIQKRDQS